MDGSLDAGSNAYRLSDEIAASLVQVSASVVLVVQAHVVSEARKEVGFVVLILASAYKLENTLLGGEVSERA